MDFIEGLERLGFSFWQLFIIGLVIVLRHELRALVARLASVRVGDKEVAFHADKSIQDLKAIKDLLENQPKDPEKAIGLINEKIDRKLISSLGEIKRSTSFLWSAIVQLRENIESNAQIQNDTFESIKGHLQALEYAGLLTYDINYIGPEQYGVQEIALKKLDLGLGQLIDVVTNT